ncbi:PQQ enzyme repeat protein [Trichuris suis]|nr:PQQ enzyme repeat protein [Trichuris suis]
MILPKIALVLELALLDLSYLIMLAIVLLLFSTSSALYEDQIGKFDWRKQFVGCPKLFAYEPTHLSLWKSIFVITENNVIASINPRNGEINWRLFFETDERNTVDALLLHENGLLCVRGHGTVLENLNPLTGVLLWEAPLEVARCDWTKLLHHQRTVYVVTCDQVRSFGASSGRLLWTTSLHKQEEIIWRDAAVDSKSGLLYVATGSHDKLDVFSVNLEDGKATPVVTIPLKSSHGALVGSDLVYVDSQTNDIIVHQCSSGEQAQLQIKAETDARIKTFEDEEFCSINDKQVVCYSKSDKAYLVRSFIQTTQNATIVDVHRKGKGRLVSLAEESGLTLALYDMDGTHISQAKVPFDSSVLSLPLMAVTPLFANETLSVKRVFLVTNDCTMAMLRPNGKPFWTRYESLASVVSTELIDLPLSEQETILEEEFSIPMDNVFRMFTNRVTKELLQLKSYLLRYLNDVFGLASFLGQYDWLALHLLPAWRPRPLERDHFGLRKMLVVTTAQGRIFGMDSATGQVLWHFSVPGTEPLGSGPKFFPLFVQRTTAYYSRAAQCATVMKRKSSGNGVVMTFNPITGDIVEVIDLEFPLCHASATPLKDPQGLTALILWPLRGEKAYLFPATLKRTKPALVDGRPVYFLHVDRTSGLAEGYKLLEAVHSDVSSAPVIPWSVSKQFTLNLTIEEGSEIVDFQMKHLDAKVHSQGRVLGNRSVLYKYLNPNIAVALIRVPSAQGTDVTVLAFDGITGRPIYAVKENRANPPYHLIVCENWIVYSFWNEKYRRTEVSVLEMYEGEVQANPTSFSSLYPLEPLVYHQSYIFPQKITSLAVTETEKAITPRFLLIAMPFGGIVELPKSFLDPRRTVNLTQELKEEGIIPYAPDLPIATDHIINYNLSVHGVHSIYTAPSGMESTSMVFAAGLDLFFTRVSPAGAFDMLKDGFDHWFIATVLIARRVVDVASLSAGRTGRMSITVILRSGMFSKECCLDRDCATLAPLRHLARQFIEEKYPEGETGDALENRLLLFKHDLNSLNILQLLVDPSDLTDQAMVEIVVSRKLALFFCIFNIPATFQ